MTRTRHMTLADLETVLEWAADEGWNPGVEDAEAFLAADPEGFFVTEDDGVPVAAISVVNHSPDFAFLGLYLCRPSHRGRGIGYALWQHALEHAGHRTVGLDGVPEQQQNYVRSGFAHAGSTVRYAGKIEPVRDGAIRLARPDEAGQLIAMEAEASGTDKPAYLAAWFTNTGTRKTFVLGKDGKIDGIVTVRKCRTGAKIGPLIASDAAGALRLIRHAADAIDPALMIDVPAASAALDALCRSLGLDATFHTARMYRGRETSGRRDFFAVATLELG